MKREPYPGLRPFKPEEHDLFFGQERNIDELFQRLTEKNFIAVLGESGCGKSSLVRAGLIPTLVPLHEGAVRSWRAIVTQPGMDPIRNLAQSMEALTTSHARAAANVEDVLREGPLGLINVVERYKDPTKKFLLILVDQFEELFRFRREGLLPQRDDQAALYVKLLLNAVKSEAADVYIVITMRSEYLGEASQFYNLAEAISDGLFLLPRMTRVQCEEAIVEPALSVGAELPQSIVQRLLNETEERQDGLPLLQHALRRLWDTANRDLPQAIALPTKFAAGGTTDFVQWSLNDHLDEILGKLDPERQQITAKVFKLLGERDFRGRLVRKPTEWGEVKAAGRDEKTVLNVINEFRDEDSGRTFLVPSQRQCPILKDKDKLDISHEVLLRQWATYSKWLKREAEDAERYNWLADAADRRAEGSGDLLQGLELASLVKWREQFNPSASWASRYTGAMDETLQRNRRDYRAAMDFLDASLSESKRAEKRKRNRRIAFVAGPLLLVCGFVSLWFWFQRIEQDKEISRLRETISVLHALDRAVDPRQPTDGRVADAIHAARSAREIPILRQELNRIPLNQWELFSALRRGGVSEMSDATQKGRLLPPAGPHLLRSSCGVSVASIEGKEFVAVADGQELRVWRLADDPQPAPKPVGESALSPGIDCVMFSDDGKQLLAFSYPDPRSAHPVVAQFSFDGKSLNGESLEGHVIPTGDNPLVAVSFVKSSVGGESERVAVLTSEALTIYSLGSTPSAPTSFAAPITFKPPQLAQLGFFSPDGYFLIVSHTNGATKLYRTSGEPATEKEFPPISGALQIAAFSHYSDRIIMGSDQGYVTVRNNPLITPKCRAPRPNLSKRLASSVSAVDVRVENCDEQFAAGEVDGSAEIFSTQSILGNRATSQHGEGSSVPGYNEVRCFHQGAVTRVSFSSDGTELITASEDKKVRVCDVDTGLERARIRHQKPVVYAGKTNAGILSASKDVVLQITKFDQKEQTVLQNRLPSACAPTGSAVSGQNIRWVWACSGEIQFRGKNLFDPKDQTPLGENVTMMRFSQDESALVWLDEPGADQPGSEREVKVHYAAAPSWKPVEQPVWVQADSQSPIVAVSAHHKFVAISHCIEKGCNVERFKADESGSLKIEGDSIKDEKHRILSLDVSDQGWIAAGTAEGYLLCFNAEGKVCSPDINLESKPAVASPDDGLTAVAFTLDGHNILVAKADQWLGIYSSAGKLLRSFPMSPEDSANLEVPAKMFVFAADGRRGAAISSTGCALFFSLDEKLQKDLVLCEPGPIQSLAFRNNNTAITSVVVNNSLARYIHNLNIEAHEKSICHNRPKWIEEQIKREGKKDDCKDFQQLGDFWQDEALLDEVTSK